MGNNKLKHSKGKWEAELDKALYFKIKVEPDLYVEIFDSEMTEAGVLEANAKLIASAPEMLEVLMDLENDNNSIPKPIWNKVQNVIKKAVE